ncbi:hypothetical protein [Mycobacterium szulgai]|uniref:OmpR/PhoB-type domain-containing protein n=1 Tax=Mycobacterium szulgai TaxID=1787 RepID=A0A1X2FBD5_MYCSZ|nr:hypothetical protein [Mycobacterium szulgai]MCV7079721.1 hypothetical protein [Mycobacterium szulgai]ORX15746.1 hypothetical protein AWC27_18850 [Mycobacterium szulgai]
MDAASEVEPSTALRLLRLLKVDGESVTRQQSAISGWLLDHTPTAALRCSLRANGYGLLLPRLPK